MKKTAKNCSTLFEFVNNEVIPGTDIKSEEFWDRFSKAVHILAPINKNLIEKREIIQKKIDSWHKSNRGKEFNQTEYVNFLKSIEYLKEEGSDFIIETKSIDEEISTIAGPQLVVPVDNARYALNAANARWGSLYDALYGTDVIPGNIDKNWDQKRAQKVIEYVRNFLDENVPLKQMSWKEISKIQIEEDNLVFFSGSKKDYLNNNHQFIGFNEKS